MLALLSSILGCVSQFMCLIVDGRVEMEVVGRGQDFVYVNLKCGNIIKMCSVCVCVERSVTLPVNVPCVTVDTSNAGQGIK